MLVFKCPAGHTYTHAKPVNGLSVLVLRKGSSDACPTCKRGQQ